MFTILDDPLDYGLVQSITFWHLELENGGATNLGEPVNWM